MKRFSAQYVITNTGRPLKRAVINTEDDGTIISIEKTGGDLKEESLIEFYNGIIVPGFVNCHCHLELSYLKNKIPEKTGLPSFLNSVMNSRKHYQEMCSALEADTSMYNEGIVLIGDVCNTADTFEIKKTSRIKYISLIEVFGLDPDKAEFRLNEVNKVAETAKKMNLPFSLVPHSAYSLSNNLLKLLKKESSENELTSIHFMESGSEMSYLENQNGPLRNFYVKAGLIHENYEASGNHTDIILNEITESGNLILVHNTFADKKTIRNIKKRNNLFWCICPGSNLYIENKLPDLNLLTAEGCNLVIGTDSLASNKELSILNELKLIGQSFPDISLENLIMWATLNGAEALNERVSYGSIEPGKKPGLLLIQDVDLQNMKLQAASYVKRLI